VQFPLPRSTETLSDVDKHRLSASIDDRLLKVARRLRLPNDAEQNIQELKAVIRDCDRLLNAPPSQYFSVPPRRLAMKKVDAERYMADLEVTLGNTERGKELYESAATKYRELGASHAAVRSIIELAAVEALIDHDRDAAIDRLLALLDETPGLTLASAEVLTALGEMYGSANEEVVALEYLKQAEVALDGAGFTVPSGSDIARELTAALMTAGEQEGAQNSAAFLGQNSANALYKRIFKAYVKIYSSLNRHEDARQYRLQLDDMEGSIREGSRTNLEFTQEMSKNIEAILKKLMG
jgi:hypothetical protein